MTDQFKDVTRFEVIDESGRAYTASWAEIELSLQDDGRTLKVFVKKREGDQPARPAGAWEGLSEIAETAARTFKQKRRPS